MCSVVTLLCNGKYLTMSHDEFLYLLDMVNAFEPENDCEVAFKQGIESKLFLLIGVNGHA